METATAQTKVANGIENIFILAVKEGNFVNHYNIQASDLQTAISSAKKYCESAGTKRRFIHVRPFLTDLEKKHNEEIKAS